MFAYCNNNPVMFTDTQGTIAGWAVALIIGVCTVVGGVLGATTNKKLGADLPEKKATTSPSASSTTPPSTSPYASPNTASNVPTNLSNSAATQNPKKQVVNTEPESQSLTTKDRVKNTFIGASLGMLVGGAIVAVGGAGLVVGGVACGAQVFAIGALAINTFAMCVAPFFGIEMEPIEVTP